MSHPPVIRAPWAIALTSLLFISAQASESPEKDWDQHMAAGNTAARSFNLAKAEREYQAALKQSRLFSTPDLRTAETLDKLANLYAWESKYSEAENLWKQAAPIMEATVGPEDSRFAYALVGLALMDEVESRPAEADPLWDRSWDILSKAGGVFDPEALATMIQVAANASRPRNYVAAEQIYQSILQIAGPVSVADHDLRIVLIQLSRVYRETKRDADAVPLMNQVLAIDARTLDADSPETSRDLGVLADLYMNQWQYEAALPLLQRQLIICQKLYRPDPASVRVEKDVKSAWNMIALVSALPSFLVLGEAAFPLLPGFDVHRPDPSDLFRVNRKLAQAEAGAGHYAEAEATFGEVIQSDEMKPHASSAMWKSYELSEDLRGLAVVYRDDRRYDEAVEAVKRAMDTDQRRVELSRVKDKDSAKTYRWTNLIVLAEIYRQKGDNTAAQSAFEESEQLAQTLPQGPAFIPRHAQLLDNYATLLRDEGNYPQAEALFRRSLDVWAKSGQPENPQLAESLSNYAVLLRLSDRPEEAVPLEAQASAIRSKIGASGLRN